MLSLQRDLLIHFAPYLLFTTVILHSLVNFVWLKRYQRIVILAVSKSNRSSTKYPKRYKFKEKEPHHYWENFIEQNVLETIACLQVIFFLEILDNETKIAYYSWWKVKIKSALAPLNLSDSKYLVIGNVTIFSRKTRRTWLHLGVINTEN